MCLVTGCHVRQKFCFEHLQKPKVGKPQPSPKTKGVQHSPKPKVKVEKLYTESKTEQKFIKKPDKKPGAKQAKTIKVESDKVKFELDAVDSSSEQGLSDAELKENPTKDAAVKKPQKKQ